MTEIIDCVAKSKMTLKKYGRDCILEIVNSKGKILFTFVIEMKRYDNFNKIETLFSQMKKLLVQREMKDETK